MQYFISFLEGIITFISPCLLPMLPIYVSYFAGGSAAGSKTNTDSAENAAYPAAPAAPYDSKRRTLINAISFVLGFTLVFIAMGALAGTFGSFLKGHQTAVNVITGFIVVFFGLNYLGIFKMNIFNGIRGSVNTKDMSMVSAFIFGVVFSVGWTPCVGAFLGSALLLASQQGHVTEGMLMLLCYSLGLGIPFILSALLIDRLKSTFDLIKKHYSVINTVCGIFLIIMGILMMLGIIGRFLALLS